MRPWDQYVRCSGMMGNRVGMRYTLSMHRLVVLIGEVVQHVAGVRQGLVLWHVVIRSRGHVYLRGSSMMMT